MEDVRERESDPQSYAIIGAAMEVHSEMGSGFLEPVYHESMAIELGLRDIPFRHEVELGVRYKGRQLNCGYRADFICFERIIVELKVLPRLTSKEIAQTINYLKASSYHIGLLINFGGSSLEFKRIVA